MSVRGIGVGGGVRLIVGHICKSVGLVAGHVLNQSVF